MYRKYLEFAGHSYTPPPSWEKVETELGIIQIRKSFALSAEAMEIPDNQLITVQPGDYFATQGALTCVSGVFIHDQKIYLIHISPLYNKGPIPELQKATWGLIGGNFTSSLYDKIIFSPQLTMDKKYRDLAVNHTKKGIMVFWSNSWF